MIPISDEHWHGGDEFEMTLYERKSWQESIARRAEEIRRQQEQQDTNQRSEDDESDSRKK